MHRFNYLTQQSNGAPHTSTYLNFDPSWESPQVLSKQPNTSEHWPYLHRFIFFTNPSQQVIPKLPNTPWWHLNQWLLIIMILKVLKKLLHNVWLKLSHLCRQLNCYGYCVVSDIISCLKIKRQTLLMLTIYQFNTNIFCLIIN